jgi:hypothetical protein
METLSIERDDVPGGCPGCGATELKRYPVLTEGGWFLVEKCQACLRSVSRQPWQRLGYVTRMEVGL